MVLYTDGSVRRAPNEPSGGAAGAGAVLMDEQHEIFVTSQPLGRMDISIAETKALLLGLQEARKHSDKITVRVDHKGLWQSLTEDGFEPGGKNANEMVALVMQIKEVMSSYEQVEIELVDRKNNLANKPAKIASKQAMR